MKVHHSVLVTIAIMAMPGIAHADIARAEEIDFSIPAGSLSQGLDLFARVSGKQVIYSATHVSSVRIKAVRGRMSPERALRALLDKSGFIAVTDLSGAIAVRRAPSQRFSQNAISTTPVQAAVAPGDETVIPADIIVTARRVDERLQDVPASVAVVSGETVQKLNILKFEDVEVLSPGLDLSKGNGYNAAATMRGLGLSPSSASPTVDVYVNDVPMDQNYAFNSMYDVGQIEVLRGPQGTLRGRPAPSGAITLTTKRPDLDEIGGYMNFLASDRNAIMGQGAVNFPVVPGVLAVRVAGVVDQSEGNGIRSVNSGVKPSNHVDSFRVTAALKPADNLEFLFTYQEMRTGTVVFPHVFGTGFVNTGAGQPPSGYNGPALASEDRLSVSERPSTVSQFQRFISWQGRLQLPQINSELIYIGASQKQRTNQINVDDAGNSIINYAPFQILHIPQDIASHELRLQSVGKNVLSYVVGLWSRKNSSSTEFEAPTVFPGAFGLPGSFSGPLINPEYSILPRGAVFGAEDHKAVFGNVTARFFDRLEVSVGARYNVIKNERLNTTVYGQGRFAATPISNTAFCAFIPKEFGGPFAVSTSLPNYCDAVIPASNTAFTGNTVNKPWTYQASAKYEFSDNLMAYASYGHSWRDGPINLALPNPGNPVIQGLVAIKPETSDTYEVGLKGSALDGRLQFSLAVFEQRFKDLLIGVSTVLLGDPGGARGTRQVSAEGLVTNADARTRGFEAEANFRILPNWSLGVSAAYATGRINDTVPCRDGNGDGVPDDIALSVIQTLSDNALTAPPAPGALTQANPVAFCQSDEQTNRSPNLSLTAQSEISFPFGDNDEFYLRGLFSYKPRNNNALGSYVVPSDTNLNLYAGVQLDERIDIGVFAKNVFNQDDETSRGDDVIEGTAGLGQTGYFTTSRTMPREVGLTVRATFGSR